VTLPRRLLVLRLIWGATFVFVLVLFAAGIPATFHYLHGVCRVAPQNCINWQLTPAGLQSLRSVHASLDEYAGWQVALDLASSVVWLALGLLMFWRIETSRMVAATAFFSLLFPAGTFGGVTSTLGTSAAWHGPVAVAQVLGQLSIPTFFLVFPDGRFVPRWSWLIILFSAVFVIPQILFPGHPAFNTAFWTFSPMVALLGVIAVQVYRYRAVSTPVERVQTRLVILAGAYAVVGILCMLTAVAVLVPASAQSTAIFNALENAGWYIFLLPIPVSIGFAVFRYRLWDVDVLINRTLVYGSLTISLGAIYLLSVIGLQTLFRAVTGQGSDIAIAVSTLAIAALFQPFRRRIQRLIDRRFYRRKYDAVRTLAAFSGRLRDNVSLDELSDDIVSVAHETVQPSRISLWVR
jgi:hypothetical protein